MNTHLVISTATELLRIPARQIIYISSEGNYSTIYLSGSEARLVTMQLGQIAALIQEQLPELSHWFGRIGRSMIINIEYVNYICPAKQQLTLADNQGGKYPLLASKEALRELKEAIEAQINQ